MFCRAVKRSWTPTAAVIHKIAVPRIPAEGDVWIKRNLLTLACFSFDDETQAFLSSELGHAGFLTEHHPFVDVPFLSSSGIEKIRSIAPDPLFDAHALDRNRAMLSTVCHVFS
ncbi:MAG TPA: hypothetical protein VND66_02350 [Acidobacteriaceae bacterium]|nr:hypothetical protein [Acidobacteriaceae bacterium]